MPRPAAAPLAALALAASAALPPSVHARVRCLTPERLAARVQRAALAVPNPYRPTSVGWVDSEAYPLRVHYRRESDAERAASVVLPAAEHSWAAEVGEMGWPAPPPDSGLGGDDRFDIYLTNEETYGGAYTWGTGGDVWPDDAWYTLSSFIAIDENPAWIPDDWMGDYVAHEFNHALQYTLDGWEKNLFVWEMTATAVEDFVYDDTNLYTLDFVDYQEMPFLSLIFDGYRPEVTAYDDWSYYEYGGAIFGIFLEQRYGADDGALLLALWEGLAFGDRADEPDVLDSMALLSPAEAPDVSAIYLDFAEWRLFAADWDDGAHFDEGALWEEDAKAGIAAEFALSSFPLADLQPSEAPYDLGATYWEVDLGGGADGSLEASAVGDAGADWGVVAVAWPASGPATVVKGRGPGGTAVDVSLPLQGASRVVLGVADLGPADMDAEAAVPRRTFTLALAHEPPDPGGDDDSADDDTSPPADDDTSPPADDDAADDDAAGDDDIAEDGVPGGPDGCSGCGTSPGGSGMAGLALLGVAARGPGRRRR